jgi:hypothetical protein
MAPEIYPERLAAARPRAAGEETTFPTAAPMMTPTARASAFVCSRNF